MVAVNDMSYRKDLFDEYLDLAEGRDAETVKDLYLMKGLR